MRRHKSKTSLMVCSLLLCCIFLISCSSETTGVDGEKSNSASPTTSHPTTSTIDLDQIASSPDVSLKKIPVNKGDIVEESENGVIDYSSASDGYFMAKYTGEKTGDESDIVLLITTPNPEFPQYRYYLAQNGEFFAFPFSEGSGRYSIGLFKRLNGTEYAQLMAVECDVSLSDELLPFLISNHKVRYTGKSLSVKLASELTKESTDFFARIESVYNYVISNITYDADKAEAAVNGELQTYVPDNDQILRSKKGICFDYATLTTAMLRSLDIPTKVIFGYASTGEEGMGPVYHAWISVYSTETGWIDGVIEFSGNGWTRMDPTFSSSSNNKTMANFIGDGSNYIDDLHF